MTDRSQGPSCVDRVWHGPRGPSPHHAISMQINQVLMTPEWALELLSRNTHNRTCRAGLVDQIAFDISSGRWQLTPQTVSVATDGTLLDGQHRLSAIVKARQSVPLMLATECPPEIFSAIDTGVSRSAGDLLRIQGISNYNNIAALIRAVTLYNKTPHLVWTATCYTLSKQGILDIYKSDPTGWSQSVEYFKKAKAYKFAHPTALASLHYLCANKSSDEEALVSQYIDLFISGELLAPGSPILAIRNYMTNYYAVAATTRRCQFQLACHIKSFTYWKHSYALKVFKPPVVVPMPLL